MTRNSEAVAVIRKLDCLGMRSSADSLYQQRFAANINGGRRMSTLDGAWKGILIGILTTQQRSTGRSNRTKKALQEPGLHWSNVASRPSAIKKYVVGFNHNRRKQEYLEGAAIWLKENWCDVRKHQRQIQNIPVKDWKARYPAEKAASDFIADGIRGIGPKQGRNFWQHRGYSAWTIPLDSRIKGILESSPFHLDMSGNYEDIEWDILQLCLQAKTMPCLLDATLFNLEALARGVVGLPLD